MQRSRRLRSRILNSLPDTLAETIRRTLRLGKLAWRDVRYDLLGEVLPMKPRAISLMANDVCNARCVMCLIWQQKKDKEITVAELRMLLDDPLFSKVENVGITGGEPTLRKDLPELFRVVAERRPRIGSASLITNAIRQKEVIERVLASASMCAERGVGFSAMVSLDGVGDVHDRNRGREGNFGSAIECIGAFRDAGIRTSIGCTITKTNAEFVDEVLDWAIENGVPARFRVAEFIDRLYNAPQGEQIRNFSPLERYHLGLFFHRLIATYERDSTIRKTYLSIRGMLAEGKKRSTGCPYHDDTVVLTSRGELLYCSPKSPILGSVLQPASASQVYFGNLDKRSDIRQNHCDDCIHDYHVPVTFKEKLGFYVKSRRIGRRYSCERLLRQARDLAPPRATIHESRTLTGRNVLIVGWYGTETVGDKAILSTVVRSMTRRDQPPDCITVASFNPWITEWTRRELDLPELRVVETYTREFELACDEADEIVVGGGPLMDLESLNHILFAFLVAKRGGAVARVEGCGIGPLRNPIFVEVVRQILRLSDDVGLRDTSSVERARRDLGVEARLVTDPAAAYVHDFMEREHGTTSNDEIPQKRVVNFFLRDWPRVYAGGMDDQTFADLRQRFESELVLMMEHLAMGSDCSINLLPMNVHADGGDDRVLNRRLVSQLVSRGSVRPEQVEVARLPVSPAEILRAMSRATLNVCMRYHSVLFSEIVGRDFLAIDYTGGGKVEAFLADREKLQRMVTVQQFATGKWQGLISGMN